MRLSLAITGASGSVYGVRLLEVLLASGIEVDLILSEVAPKVVSLETDLRLPEEGNLATWKRALAQGLGLSGESVARLHLWANDNLAAKVASGSHRSDGMIVAPCSMGALARIAHGTSENLIARCADVCLKERFPLLLLVRETPLSLVHLRNMTVAAEAGALIMPAMPAFYHQPRSLRELTDHLVGKVLDSFGVSNDLYERWLSGA